MKTAVKATLAFLGAVALGVFLLVVYVANQFVDETTVSGEAHGFAIGDSKEEAYEKARALFSEQRFFRLYIPGHHQQDAFVIHRATREALYDWQPFHFTSEEFAEAAAWDNWAIHPDETFLSGLTLTFSDNRLVQIHWYQKPFDLP